MNKPHFTIKNKFQKRSILYQKILTKKILEDICFKITGKKDYTVDFDPNGYNKGRMAVLSYGKKRFFISFSDTEAAGRNSSFQSVVSALLSYYEENISNKKIFFYFLSSKGQRETNYFKFMYRLMITAGIRFLNIDALQDEDVQKFTTVDDIINARNINRNRNRGNNSSYVTRGKGQSIQIYGKTYGANKYETTLISLALSCLSTDKIELYEICEGSLSNLPQKNLKVIESLGKVKIIPTNFTFEKKEFEKGNSIRSPRYIYNLLQKLGPKKCSLCSCEIPQLIEGSHIWPVAEIKKTKSISLNDKIEHAINAENGLWLCENHHKMLDEGLIIINLNGNIECRKNMIKKHAKFIKWATTVNNISSQIMTKDFKKYLIKRNKIL